MAESNRGTFQEWVTRAAEAVLARDGSVGPLELFQELRWLPASHFEGWRKGDSFHPTLEQWIGVGPAKFQRAIKCFKEWVQSRGLRAIEVPYTRQSPQGLHTLQVTQNGDPQWEKFYRTRYLPAELTEKQTQRAATKLAKTPDLVVFEKVSQEGRCHECQVDLWKGSYVFMEKGQPLCLACADLDHLVFLPAGDMALSRRARKHSALSAVVVRFSRARKRYERQGLLVGAQALAQAQSECHGDADIRAVAREHAAIHRVQEDLEFVEALRQAILAQYPGCPPEAADQIARHTGQRHSGRVGRSAAGRALDPQAIELAVAAHLRHQHTSYDQLLMQGVDRLDARRQVRDQIQQLLAQWSGTKKNS